MIANMFIHSEKLAGLIQPWSETDPKHEVFIATGAVLNPAAFYTNLKDILFDTSMIHDKSRSFGS